MIADTTPKPHVIVDLKEDDAARIAIRLVDRLPRPLMDHFEDSLRKCGAAFAAKMGAATLSLDRTLEIQKRLNEGRVPLRMAVTTRCADALMMVANIHRQRVLAAQEIIERLKASGSGQAMYPFQVEGVAVLATTKAWLLYDEQGLGKTVQALCAANEDHGLLVVAPASAKGNWIEEARTWRQMAFGEVLSGGGSFRYPMPGEIVVLNYEITPPVSETEFGRFHLAPKCTLVFDEIHWLKNWGTEKKPVSRTRRGKSLADAVLRAGGWVYGLTGTPLQKTEPDELWTIADVCSLARTAFGSKARLEKAFREKGAVAEMLRSISLRRERAEVLPDLPTKIYKTVFLEELIGEVRRVCDNALLAAQRLGIDVEKVDDLAWIRAIGGHIMSARRLLAEAKTAAAVSLVERFEEEGEPVVVFSAHRPPVEIIGNRPGWRIIDGDTPPDERTQIVREFQSGKLKGVAITIRAGGIAITLTRAHVGIFVDREWSPGQNKQAEDRICRIGQDRGVVIYDVVARHLIERSVLRILKAKELTIAQTVESSAIKEGEAFDRDKRIAEQYEAIARSVTTLEPLRLEPPKKTPTHNATTYVPKVKRMPSGLYEAREEWTARGLLKLHHLTMDADAKRQNLGFAHWDAGFGQSLAKQIAEGGLTDAQWEAGYKMLQRYPRQVGFYEEKGRIVR